ncbi:hypothetical protein CCC_01449 [Paramagnetospirillum magnetotacticum MS-1]|uniref:Uncharacterized protein n=1 Tax=Paramagnetospirillum magnetotacticum MS-1 TaxID=272627 RepID=A0A0C2UVV7_PARME|nr:hypothetical protein CCC_01449 [Paramagnetospirillum magnetotacticum MS-1]
MRRSQRLAGGLRHAEAVPLREMGVRGQPYAPEADDDSLFVAWAVPTCQQAARGVQLDGDRPPPLSAAFAGERPPRLAQALGVSLRRHIPAPMRRC